MLFDIDIVRQQFPALSLEDEGVPRIYLDNPAGTQVPLQVLNRMQNYLVHMNANHGGSFRTSRDSDRELENAHQGMADLLNAASGKEIVFGPNMTSLTYTISRALGRGFAAGDALLLTRMDHDANVTPWMQLAEDQGMEVRWLEFDAETYQYRMEDLERLLAPGDVKLAAINYASNCLGTINDVQEITRVAHQYGALVYVDAVQYVPHGITDVQALECDFLVCSPYKFFGPHQGVLWGRYDLLDKLEAYRVRPADGTPPGKFETGTQSHEGQSATLGVIEYLAWVGMMMEVETPHSNQHEPTSDSVKKTRRTQLCTAMTAICEYEKQLSTKLIQGLTRLPGVTIRGISDLDSLNKRVPTVSFTVAGHNPSKIADYLASKNIFVWDGHNYALEAVRVMGLEDKGGVVRIGPVHYNTMSEIDLLLETLEGLLR